MSFSLATIKIKNEATPAVKIGSRIYALKDLAPNLLQAGPQAGLMNLFADWASSEKTLVRIAQEVESGINKAAPLDIQPTPSDFLTPLQYPSKVVCMGANYYDHMRGDAGMTDFQKENVVPTMFTKPASTTLVGSGQSVRYPSQTSKFDWEIELCAIVGKRGRKIPAKNARDYIAAFTVGIDLSARDWQLHPKHPFKFDVYGGKAFDDSCPLGPWLVPARYVDDKNLHLQLSLNGEIKQDANTRDMIWSIEEQIEALSLHVTLEPGDVIMTGTPAGVGMKTGTYMKVGDKLDALIEGVGLLQVEIMPDQEAPLAG